MTREEHIAEYNRYWQTAMDNLKAFQDSYEAGKSSFDWSKYEAYEANMKIANRHIGISHAMWKKQMKKLYGYTG